MFPGVKNFPDVIQYLFLQMFGIYKMNMWMPFYKEKKFSLNITLFTESS